MLNSLLTFSKKQWVWLVIATLIIVLILVINKDTVKAEYELMTTPENKQKSFLNDKTKTSRNVRNNNPGNLRDSGESWRGQLPSVTDADGSFKQFKTWHLGCRAMIKLLSNYIKVLNRNTIRKIVAAYAPNGDGTNHEATYREVLRKFTGKGDDDVLVVSKELLWKLTQGIFHMETEPHERTLYTRADFDTAYNLL